MQIDMHYYGTFAMARAGGFTNAQAQIIANAAQFIDDNAVQADIKIDKDGCWTAIATAHHSVDIENLSFADQRKVWVPFHFIPGNVGDKLTARLRCIKDSPIANAMMANNIQVSQRRQDEFGLYLLGVSAHVYADTFSHYGFSGVGSKGNLVAQDSIEFAEYAKKTNDWLSNKLKNFDYLASMVPRWSEIIQGKLAETIQADSSLGHGGVATFPDQPYLKWRFEYEEEGYGEAKTDWRDNQATFLEYCQKIHSYFAQCNNKQNIIAWEKLEPAVRAILAFEGSDIERSAQWQLRAENGQLYGFSEKIPDYNAEEWNQETALLTPASLEQFKQSNIFKFQQAAQYHLYFVGQILLPKYNIFVV